MEQKDIDLIKNEFNRTRDMLSDIAVKRHFSYEEFDNSIKERQNSYVMTISSISIAIIGIVFPIIGKESVENNHLNFPILLLGFTSILGFVISVFFIYFDRWFAKKQWERDTRYMDKLIGKSTEIYDKADAKNIKWDDIGEYFNFKEKGKEIYIKEDDNIFSKYIDVHFVYFGLFLIGLIMFLYSIFSINKIL
ncbi:MAG: hypothetical protein NT170_03890 [Candidatus Moranbacteria bacterium]|nr:hypothetical protein [Candidatus Moranbacteria bacterium]